jgi:lysyl-tRNA synthetase class 1
MFWSDKIAQEIKKRKLPLEWVDDMKTPSGRVHVGALRGVVVHDLVYKSLKQNGVNAKYTYVFENHDPMDDIPSYLSREKYEQYLGMPLFKVPSPQEGYTNFAEYYALEFKKVFNAIDCNPEIIWTKDLYTSGKMNNAIKVCLDNANEIKKIFEDIYKKTLAENWYPFQLYCPNCGKVSTTTVTDWDGKEVTYTCEVNKVKWTTGCGSSGKTSPFSNAEHMAGKLPWKVEWGAKWQAIGVTIEGAGKDHMSKGGSHDVTAQICQKVLKYPVPYPIPYEWFLIGGRKMSSSKGVGTSAKDMLEILPPELLRFLMVRTKISQAINFDPSGDTIPRLFDEYQKAAQAYYDKTDEELGRTFELSQIGEAKKPTMTRFSILAQWVQMPNMQEQIKAEGLDEWAKYARVWVEKYAPQEEKFLVQKETPVLAKELSSLQKEYLQKVADKLKTNWNADELQKFLYELTKEMNLPAKEGFAAIYIALLGKNHGPKAAWLILSLDSGFVQHRFSHLE